MGGTSEVKALETQIMDLAARLAVLERHVYQQWPLVAKPLTIINDGHTAVATATVSVEPTPAPKRAGRKPNKEA